MGYRTNTDLIAIFKRLSVMASLSALVIGLSALFGWAIGIAPLKTVFPELATMKANTAFCFIFSGASILILRRRWLVQQIYYSGYFFAILVAVIGALTLIQDLWACDIGIDQLLFADNFNPAGSAAPGRMALATAVNFSLLGIALVLFGAGKAFKLMQAIVFTTLVISLLALLGYVYGASSLYSLPPYSSMALYTAISFIVLGLSLLWARAEQGVMTLITSEGLAGIMLRRLLPSAFIIPFVVGWVRLAGQRAGYYDTEFGLAIHTLTSVLTFAVIAGLTARLLHQADAERTLAQDALRQAHDEMEMRVKERTAELEAGNKQLSYEIAERRRSEESLRESEERFRLALLEAPIPMLLHTDDNLILNVSKGWTLLSGYTIEDIPTIGDWTELAYGERKDFSKDYIDRLFANTKTVYNGEWTITAKDGTKRLWHFSTTTLGHLNDGRRLLLSSAIDVTESKQAAAALQESGERLMLTLENAELGMWDWDIPTGAVIYDDRWAAIHGYRSGELPNRIEIWERTLHPDDKQKVYEALNRNLASDDSLYDVEYRAFTKSGTWIWINARGRVQQHDEEGRPLRMMGTVQNIMERKRSEEALRDSEERYRQIVDHASDIIYRADSFGCFTYVNPVAMRIMKYYEDELIGMHFIDLVRKDYRQQTADFYKTQLIEKEANTYNEFPAIAKDGEEVWIGQHVQLVIEDDRITGFQAVARDITKRKQVEKELEQARIAALNSAQMKAEFLANMSHEIRTPMNGVVGLTELLLSTSLTSEQNDFAVSIQNSAEALLIIINDILDFSKIEAGKLRLEHIDFDIREVVEGTVEMLAQKAHAKGIEIASLIFKDVHIQLCGDPGRLRQIITNLLGNAVKFTEHGEVILQVRKEKDAGTQVLLRFEVKDTGIGIARDVQQHLFTPFSQADGSTARKFGGTGLGLAISKQLVELMGGEIGVESTPGHGSTFWFTAHFERQTPNLLSGGDTSPCLEGRRILIVDHNHSGRRILSYLAGSWGMMTAEAETGARAIERLRSSVRDRRPFDMAILDLNIPDMGGFELARRIKSDPQIAGTHLMLLSPYGQRGHGRRARQMGFDSYLPKPIRQSELYNSLITINSRSIDDSENTPEQPDPQAQQKPDEHKETGIKHQGINILLAEDNLINQKVAIKQLQRLGYTADVATTGLEVLEALKHKQYDLILMDCQMPDMDGYETTARIREIEGSIRHIKIISMTAHAIDGEREKCLAAGMDDYMSKPVKTEVLKQMLDRWCRAET